MMKSLEHPLYKWNKWGKYWVWEGNNLVAAGNKGMGYVVQDKDSITIRKDGISGWHKGYYGTYKTRKEALDNLKAIDSAMDKGEELIIEVSGGDPKGFELGGSWLSHTPKTGARVIVYHKDFPSDLFHELEHKRLEYYEATPGQEVEVVGETIKRLKEEGLYTPEVRERTIGMLSGYLKGKRKEARVLSEDIVANLEEGKEPSIGKLNWKVRKGKLI